MCNMDEKELAQLWNINDDSSSSGSELLDKKTAKNEKIDKIKVEDQFQLGVEDFFDDQDDN